MNMFVPGTQPDFTLQHACTLVPFGKWELALLSLAETLLRRPRRQPEGFSEKGDNNWGPEQVVLLAN